MISKTQNLAIIAIFIMFFINFQPNGACRLLNGEFEETWMKNGNLLLSSLQRGTVRPPGNGCSNTGNGGNPCIGAKKAAMRNSGAAAPPPSLVTLLSSSIDQ
ncbi:hypothetical protein OSB04_023249 [Centaurea solstitialis]|uniref:Uncharacterized protein n=1 Tax=Centaurea solstitialis TaxID=347529 RepID=A0AA38W237_9ASTR|nr:hypothetical protein OSB04_023249 [Centaurea solstitialis]